MVKAHLKRDDSEDGMTYGRAAVRGRVKIEGHRLTVGKDEDWLAEYHGTELYGAWGPKKRVIDNTESGGALDHLELRSS